MNQYKVYFAHPIVGISDEDKSKHENIKQKLKEAGFEIYDPSELKIENAYSLTMAEWAACVFDNDMKAIRSADWIISCDYGRSLTSGTAFETGFAYGIKKHIWAIDMTENKEISLMTYFGCNYRLSYSTFMDLNAEWIQRFWMMNTYGIAHIMDNEEIILN